jgi:hypothetical protein
METPETPEELLGQEPSLFYLLNHYLNNKDDYGEIDASVLRNYNIANDKDPNLPKYSFYLGGQIRLNAEIGRITKSIIDETKEIIAKKDREYGGPTNSYEYASIEKSKTNFDNLQRIIERYYSLKMHDLYRPADPNVPGDAGGIEYQKLEKTTRIGRP